MNNSSIWNFRFPTILGLVLLSISVMSISWVANHNTQIIARADSTIVPENIRITNISDTSVTVSYITRRETIGTVAYGNDSTINKIALDDRDGVKPFFMHHVTIKNLQPQSKYFFAIVVDGKQFLKDNAYFELTTAPKLETAQVHTSSLRGKVAFPKSFEETIVYVTNQNSQAFSSLVHADGSYDIPLTTLRTRDLLTFFTFPDDEILQMLLISPTHESVVTLTGKEKNNIPLILLSESYDFTLNPKPHVLSAYDTDVSFPILDKKKIKNNKLRKPSVTPTKSPQNV